ncbi:MAG: tetratricopeptide repeat protein, partial [Promethearchaeota archaeon]
MSRVTELNLPPEEISKKIWGTRKNVEHLILWLLKNNDIVEWADFLEEPISIPQSTLSNYLRTLYLDGYIEKVKRGEYIITARGEDRFNELSRASQGERKLNYPPEVISDKRNYDDIILWMAYNNKYLKWSDFLDDKASVFINQSALSKNINLLLKKELIRKDDNKEYHITQAGKADYARILKLYDLDRQSILNEESKRIEEITRKTIGFFEKNKIENDDIKFRFLNNVLTLPFEKLKGSLDTEEDYNKIQLYLSTNHPNQYPGYVSTAEFSEKYNIDKLDLEFNIRKIVDKGVFSVKFFKLSTDEEKIYYFQANEKIEKVLRAVTEDYITKFTYLNKLYEKTSNGSPPLTLESTVEAILDEICDRLFNSGLKQSLKEFLPDYINYLAYRMEKERKLDDITDKLEGTIWQEFQYYNTANATPQPFEEDHEYYYLHPQALYILEPYINIPEFSTLIQESKELLKSKKYDEVLIKVGSLIKSEGAKFEFGLFKAIVLCHMNKFLEAIDLIESELEYEKHQNDEIKYLSASYVIIFAYTSLGHVNEALDLMERIFEINPEHPITIEAKAMIYGYSVIYDFDAGEGNDDYVLDLIDEAIRADSYVVNKAIFYVFKVNVLEQMYKLEEALEEINAALTLTTEFVDFYYVKSKLLSTLERYDESFAVLEDNIDKFPESKNHFLMQKAYVLKMMGNLEDGLEIVSELTETYPDNDLYFNNKAYWHIYLYKQNREKGVLDETNKQAAIDTIRKLTERAPHEGNFFDSYGEILMITGDYESAIEKYKKAIEVEPNGWFVPASYVGLGKCYKKIREYDEAELNFHTARKIV